MRHRFFSAIVGHGKAAAAGVEQRQRVAHHCGEGIAADIQRHPESLPAGGAVRPVQLVTVGECHGVNQDVDVPQLCACLGEQALEIVIAGKVALLDEIGAHLLSQRGDAPQQRRASVAEGKLRSFAVQRLGNAPGD